MTERPPVHASPRRFPLQMQQPIEPARIIDRLAMMIGAAAAVWLAVIMATQGFRHWYSPILLVPVWAIIAYLALPRLHRMLSDLYVPDYFFGRTRTGDGLLGDPVNLAVDGSFAQLDHVMLEAGWHRADEITLRSTWGIIVSTVLRRSYPTAPVSPLFLFNRRHDVAYEQEVAGDPKQRHHVRFWHCPPGWLLPGGARTDWLGAGTYDTNVGVSLFTLQVTHRIDANTDVERDFVVSGVRAADPAVGLRTLHDFTTGYHSRNGGGDRFITDGDLPVLELGTVEVPRHLAPQADERMRTVALRAPLSIVLGLLAVIGGVVYEIATIIAVVLQVRPELADVEGSDLLLGVVVGALSLLALSQVVFAVLVLRGGARGSRFVLLVLLTAGVLLSAIGYASGDVPLEFDSTLLGNTVHCLALIALSSESAAAWTRRPRPGRTRQDDPNRGDAPSRLPPVGDSTPPRGRETRAPGSS
ncbi:hypothetical protein HNR16_002847 [Pseudoclavibacter chungangensis]|uniref:LssY C-terminal domain-containing protein n=1 Tax=Pseudoclavibacter chungangensis TaxID=587635 RepID=UPI0017BA9BCE|nr:LssY C-terminal domain-containing protein [Pseudoclavibacter chungangensis]NYJ68059.1 hypothetical protein [Pseudoclavibacter chungangensis]